MAGHVRKQIGPTRLPHADAGSERVEARRSNKRSAYGGRDVRLSNPSRLSVHQGAGFTILFCTNNQRYSKAPDVACVRRPDGKPRGDSFFFGGDPDNVNTTLTPPATGHGIIRTLDGAHFGRHLFRGLTQTAFRRQKRNCTRNTFSENIATKGEGVTITGPQTRRDIAIPEGNPGFQPTSGENCTRWTEAQFKFLQLKGGSIQPFLPFIPCIIPKMKLRACSGLSLPHEKTRAGPGAPTNKSKLECERPPTFSLHGICKISRESLQGGRSARTVEHRSVATKAPQHS